MAIVSELTLALGEYSSVPDHWLVYFEQIICADVKTVPSLLFSSQPIRKPDEHAISLPSVNAIID